MASLLALPEVRGLVLDDFDGPHERHLSNVQHLLERLAEHLVQRRIGGDTIQEGHVLGGLRGVGRGSRSVRCFPFPRRPRVYSRFALETFVRLLWILTFLFVQSLTVIYLPMVFGRLGSNEIALWMSSWIQVFGDWEHREF